MDFILLIDMILSGLPQVVDCPFCICHDLTLVATIVNTREVVRVSIPSNIGGNATMC